LRARSSRSLRTQGILAAALPLAYLAPFVTKAVHIDDPFYIWTARHILSDPLHPYAFDVNWYGTSMPVGEITKNPPLVSYYIALVAGSFGESEWVLHAAFFVPAIAVVVTTLLFARRSCEAPLVAALLVVASPLFLISSSTLMCDTLMLAFWMAGLLIGVAGIERERAAPVAVSAGLGTAAALTKYFGLCLVPLLFLHAWTRKRRIGAWAVPLLLPVGALLAYEAATRSGSGMGQVFSAFAYVANYRTNSTGGPLWGRALGTLAFAGGGTIPALVCAPVLWSRRAVLGGLAAVAGIAIGLQAAGALGSFALPAPALERSLFAVQFALFAAGGAGVVALALGAWGDRDHRDAKLLSAWVLGTMTFAIAVNWTVNARTVLPIVPAVAVLVARRIEARRGWIDAPDAARRWVIGAFALGSVVSLAALHADDRFADAARTAARTIMEKYGRSSIPVWFEGHWGFQYYMEQEGARAADLQAALVGPGDILVIPSGNTNVRRPPDEYIELLEELTYQPTRWVATVCRPCGTRFYFFGPLPYGLARVPAVTYRIYRVRDPRDAKGGRG
jgi:4-amino-4-deoxy-L-arabinose transferase-like glycosyltransferase